MNWTKIEPYLTSLRLTLGLFFAIALYSAFGTLQQRPDGRYELFFQHPLFRTLLFLLAINMLACTIKTVRRNFQDRRRHFSALSHLPAARPASTDTSPAAIVARLQGLGYLVQEEDGTILAQRHLPGRWGSTVVHLSALLIMAGALSSGLGFVGTINLLSGDKSGSYFDWHSQSDRPLGFELRLDHFEPLYYPIELQFVALDPASRKELATITAREGEMTALPGGYSARVLRYYFFEEDLVLNLYRQGEDLGLYHALGGDRKTEKNPPVPMILKPLAYRDPIVRQLRSEVSILKGGEVVKRGVITVNDPLAYEGVTIFQTVYNRDKFGFWSAGFQLGRDPGEPLVWAGSIALVLGLLLTFFYPYQALGVTGKVLVPLVGFTGEAGEIALRRVEEELNNH